MSDRLVTIDIEQRIAWVTFNRPEKRNCMNPALNARMLAVLAELEFREDIGVLVLSGAGGVGSPRRHSLARSPPSRAARAARSRFGAPLVLSAGRCGDRARGGRPATAPRRAPRALQGPEIHTTPCRATPPVSCTKRRCGAERRTIIILWSAMQRPPRRRLRHKRSHCEYRELQLEKL